MWSREVLIHCLHEGLSLLTFFLTGLLLLIGGFLLVGAAGFSVFIAGKTYGFIFGLAALFIEIFLLGFILSAFNVYKNSKEEERLMRIYSTLPLIPKRK